MKKLSLFVFLLMTAIPAIAQDEVVIYSNGIADFTRHYSVPKGDDFKIAIPVNRDQVGDVLASIDVFGPVRLRKPTAFEAGKKASLEIDPEHATTSILKAMSGSRIKIRLKSDDTGAEGTLLGIEDRNGVSWVSLFSPKEGRVLKFDLLKDVTEYSFLDADDRSQVTSALLTNHEKIKPGSTTVELSLQSDQDAKAIVQYAIPVAAWTMSYRLHVDDKKSTLEGMAVVHNTTEFDWNQFQVSVVTGMPHTFTHDLAQGKMPRRSHVNITPEFAQGNVTAEQEQPRFQVASADRSMRAAAPGRSESAMSSNLAGREFAAPAERSEASVSKVGDFTVMKSTQPVDIMRNRSALVPMFVKTVLANKVVYYKPAENQTVPFAAARFTNDTGMSVTKGVVTVFDGTLNSGEAVLEAMRPTDEAIVPYAASAFVRTTRKQNDVTFTDTSIKLLKGEVLSRREAHATTIYTFDNRDKAAATTVLDHPFVINSSGPVQPTATVSLTRSDGKSDGALNGKVIPRGKRFTFFTTPESVMTARVDENWVYSQTAKLDSQTIRHYGGTYFPNDPKIKAAIAIADEIDGLEKTLIRLDKEYKQAQELFSNANATLKNLQDAERKRWVDQLTKSQETMDQINNTKRPAAEAKLKDATERLEKMIATIAASWTKSK